MNKVKTIIFSDLDGTLLDHYTYQATAAEQTLLQLKNADIPVILNTSKTRAELDIIIDSLNLSAPFIVENGAAVYIPINTFKKQPEDTVVIDNYWVKSFSLPRQHWLTLLSTNTSEFNNLFRGFSTISDAVLCEITGLTLEETKRAKQRQYGEPLQWLGDKNSQKSFIKKLINLGANVVKGGRFIHVGDYCDKGEALIWLAKQYHTHYQSYKGTHSIQTIALGDGENDIAMLEAADIAVQIRSPVHDFTKLNRQDKATQIQTTLYGPEGWAEAIQKILNTQFISPLITQE